MDQPNEEGGPIRSELIFVGLYELVLADFSFSCFSSQCADASGLRMEGVAEEHHARAVSFSSKFKHSKMFKY